MISRIRDLTKRQIALAVATLSIVGVVGAASVTQAAPAGKPTKGQCATAGFSNYGQCVKSWAQGRGYSASGGQMTLVSERHERKVEHNWWHNWRFW